MKFIATDVDDSVQKMQEMLVNEKGRQDYAINPYFYRSHLVYQQELSALVFRSWIYAAHISELPNPGDYVLFEIGEDSIIIVRDSGAEIHALMNVCRHRGARVCEAASGNRKTFVCPYHGWVYNTDGSLKAAREMEVLEGFDTQGFGACTYHDRYGLYDGYLTGSEDGQPVAPLMGSIKDYDGGVSDVQTGPLSHMLNYPDHCVLYRFIPRSLTSTDMQVIWFVKGDAQEGVDYDKEKLIWLWHNTTLEDEFIIRRNSEGLNSHFFEPGPYHPEFESTVNDFINWYLHTLEHAA